MFENILHGQANMLYIIVIPSLNTYMHLIMCLHSSMSCVLPFNSDGNPIALRKPLAQTPHCREHDTWDGCGTYHRVISIFYLRKAKGKEVKHLT